jgi:hypothetical protein
MTDYSCGFCGVNEDKKRYAMYDTDVPVWVGDKDQICPTANDLTNNILCTYPLHAPLSIKNDNNFCATGYVPAIWTSPNLPGKDKEANVTMIDNKDEGKPVYCVKKVTKDEAKNNQ